MRNIQMALDSLIAFNKWTTKQQRWQQFSKIGRQSIAVQFSGLFILNCTCTLLILSRTLSYNQHDFHLWSLTTRRCDKLFLSLCVSLSLNLLLKTCKFSIECHHLNALLLLFLTCRYRRKSNDSKRYIASNFHYILSMTKKERQPTLLFWESKKSKIAYVPHCENSDSTQILMDIFISVSDKLWPVWTKQKKNDEK